MANYWFEPQTVSLEVGGREMTLETGRMAKQAAGAVVVTYGETVVLVTAARANPRPGIDFFHPGLSLHRPLDPTALPLDLQRRNSDRCDGAFGRR